MTQIQIKNQLFYAVKHKGHIISRPEPSFNVAYEHLKTLQLQEQAEAQVVQVTAEGKELLFG